MAEFTLGGKIAQTLFETSSEPLIVCLTDGRILALNASAIEMLSADEADNPLGQEAKTLLNIADDHWSSTVEHCFQGSDSKMRLQISKSGGGQISAEVRFAVLGENELLIGFKPSDTEDDLNAMIFGMPTGSVDSELVKRANQYMQMYQDKELLANTDSLTGADNRRAFDTKLNEALVESVAEGSPVSLLVIDADHFKKLNDTMGHQVGDTALKGLVEVIRRCIRPRDSVGRIGGEEFGIVLSGADREQAVLIAERIRAGVETTELCPAPVTISIGVATVSDVFCDALSLFAAADHALYGSKAAGRNRVTHADDLPILVDESA